jgi:hypothetical protein
MKPGKGLRRTGFTNRGNPLRRYKELRRSPLGLDKASGEGSAALHSSTMREGSSRPGNGLRTTHHPAVPGDVRAALAERSQGWCEARLEGCGGRAIDPHHRITRQRGGRRGEAQERSDQLSSVIYLCRSCHDWVHEHPAKARVLGLLLRQHQIPAMEMVAYRGEPSYLDLDGRVWSAEEVGA